MPRPLQPAVIHIVTILINQSGYSEEKHVIFIYLPWAKLTGLLWMFRGGAQDNLDNIDHSRLFLILSITLTIQICYFRMKKFTWQCAMKRTWRVAFQEYLVHLGTSRYKVEFTFGTFWFWLLNTLVHFFCKTWTSSNYVLSLKKCTVGDHSETKSCALSQNEATCNGHKKLFLTIKNMTFVIAFLITF